MALMEGKLVKLNGLSFQQTVQKTIVSIQSEWVGFIPTHISVALEDAGNLPEEIEALLASQHKVKLPIYGCKTTRRDHVFVCRPISEN